VVCLSLEEALKRLQEKAKCRSEESIGNLIAELVRELPKILPAELFAWIIKRASGSLISHLSAELEEITMESIRSVHKVANSVKKVKLVGASAKDLASKIKDDNITTTGN
jgi:hypothetical protein